MSLVSGTGGARISGTHKPVTAFYDWLYMNALHRCPMGDRVASYAGFSDIAFNPERSLNCQARSAALYVSLRNRGWLSAALESPERFLRMLDWAASQREHAGNNEQMDLL
jgi:hypothetical protein